MKLKVFALSIAVMLVSFSQAAAFEYYGLATAVISLIDSEDLSPTPNPSPSGICEDCNGEGEVGDGTVFVDCQTCGGDGRLDNDFPESIPAPVLVAPRLSQDEQFSILVSQVAVLTETVEDLQTQVQSTSSSSGSSADIDNLSERLQAQEEWAREFKEKYEKDKCNCNCSTAIKKTTPTVTIGPAVTMAPPVYCPPISKTIVTSSYSSPAYTPTYSKPVSYSASYNATAPRSVTRSSGPTWSYPGNLSSHLSNTHGVNTSGMSYSQQKVMHDNLHNSGNSGVQSGRRVFNNCANGQCGGNTRRWGLFRN